MRGAAPRMMLADSEAVSELGTVDLVGDGETKEPRPPPRAPPCARTRTRTRVRVDVQVHNALWTT